jgi:ubiquinone/menaquinone biosynthesis C-methylase UbiE
MAVATAYDGLAESWDRAAGLVYRPLARSLVAASPMALRGRLVVDAGSGTGAVAQAARAYGARVVAADRSLGMIVYQHRGSAVVADVAALPFGDGVFHAALAGFLLNHVPAVPALTELARVVRLGGVVLASTWAVRRPDPVKAAIDTLITSWGWVPPAWYQQMKADLEPMSSDPDRMAAAARQAGLVDVSASVHHEELGMLDPRGVVAYRLAMPHVAPWVGELDTPSRVELIRQALVRVAPLVAGWRPAVVLLAGRMGRQPRRRSASRPSASAYPPARVRSSPARRPARVAHSPTPNS